MVNERARPSLEELAEALGMELALVPRRDPDAGGHIVPLWMRDTMGLAPLEPGDVATSLRLGERGTRLLAAAQAVALAKRVTADHQLKLRAALREYGLW